MVLLAVEWDRFIVEIICILVVFLPLIIGIIAAAKIGIEHERSKRTGINPDQIDKIIDDARRRAYRKGNEES